MSTVSTSTETVLASGGWDNQIFLWDIHTGDRIAALEGRATRLAYSPSGKLLATGDGENIQLWDRSRRQKIAQLQGHEGHVWSQAFSPDGRHVASGGFDGTVRLWDARTMRELPIPIAGRHVAQIDTLAFCRDGRTLATAGQDGVVKLWHVGSGAELLTLTWHESRVVCIACSPGGEMIASTDTDGYIRLWAAAAKEDAQSGLARGQHAWANDR